MKKQFKLIHGDCLKVMRKIPDASIDLVLCDLPYGQTQSKWDAVIPFEPLWEQYERVGKEGAAFVLTAKSNFMIDLILSKRNLFRWELVWNKGKAANFCSVKKMPLMSHEYVLVFCSKQPTYNPQMTQGKAYVHNRPTDVTEGTGVKRSGTTISDGQRYPYSIIEVEGHSQRGLVHPTQKPLRLMEYLVKTFSNEGDVVLDNCMGSGTTGVAAISCKRKFIGIEKEENYFNIAKTRIESVPKSLF